MEISNMVSGQITDVVIGEYFQTSADYQKLQKRITQQDIKVQQLSANEKDGEACDTETMKLQQLKKGEVSFRTNALRLAESFLKIKNDTERLQKAKMLFEKGYILEADKVLVEWEIIDDQETLLAQMHYLQQRKNGMMDIMQDI
jgi:hypothetical protein